MKIFLLIYFSTLIIQPYAQTVETIRLNNPSFEGLPAQSQAPKGWIDCGFDGESAPDIHPDHYWEVNVKPQHGKTYLGMVVRNNGTWERINQQLNFPMIAGTCYEFSIFLATSNHYISGIINRSNLPRLTRSDSTYNFTTPATLRIWGGESNCDRKEILGQSNPIDHQVWKKYKFTIRPKSTHQYLMLEAFYSTDETKPYNGNILLDNASSILPVSDKE